MVGPSFSDFSRPVLQLGSGMPAESTAKPYHMTANITITPLLLTGEYLSLTPTLSLLDKRKKERVREIRKSN
jgi:hypothetical protein